VKAQTAVTNTAKVVIIGIDHSVGLQSARIFAQRNVPVIGVAREPKHFGCRTNVCEKILFTDIHNEELIECLVTLGKSFTQKAVLVPCRDLSVTVISRNRQFLEPYYHFLLPPTDVVESLMDKVGFSKFATAEGFSIPKTYVLESSSDAHNASAELSYPCIMKPGIKTDSWTKATSKKVFKVYSQEEFLESYEKFNFFSAAIIAQEWIKGGDGNLYSCNCYFNQNSNPIIAFVARKIRQWPPHVGETSLGEACRDDVVLNESIRFFAKAGFKGLGYVELKKDEKSGKYFFIEANIGRPTGRSALAEACGVELLYTMYADLLSLPLPTKTEQKDNGVKWVNLATDLMSSVVLWRQGQLTAMEWIRSLNGEKFFAILSLRDPIPFLAQVPWGIRCVRRKKK
jgi:predicted ATP-grasp superfamily ATP-dependent carboligase